MPWQLKTSNSPKPFWNFVQSKRKVKCDLVSLKVNDSYHNDDLSIANCMNSYFSSFFTVEDHKNSPDLEYTTDKNFCSATEVEKLLRKLNVYKSPRPKCISPRILRECAQVLSSPLDLFLNTSFSQGQLPCTWKSAHITPVHKKGNKNLMENYRQISLTCIVCKIAKAVVRTRVVDFWSDLNLFNPDQFAYLRGKSTLGQLFTCYNDWAKARNRSQQRDIIFLDLSKAFDSVPHERLLLKLQRHGIDGPLLLWIRNFLTNRRQCVVLGGNCSDWSPVISTLRTESPSIFLDKSGRGRNLCRHPQQFILSMLQIQIFLRRQSNRYRSIHCVCQQM